MVDSLHTFVEKLKTEKSTTYLSKISAIVQANKRSPSGNCNATDMEKSPQSSYR